MKRSRDLILSQILDICTKGATKTNIVYRANLNFRTVVPYLELLKKNGFIDVRDGQYTTYMTTERGNNLLKNFKIIHQELLS